MLVTAIIAINAAVVARLWEKEQDRQERLAFLTFTAFLNLFGLAYVRQVAKLVRTPPEDRSARQIMSLGCLIAIMLIVAIPVLLILCAT
jgi:type II secretory pathway pseudopilin PulG